MVAAAAAAAAALAIVVRIEQETDTLQISTATVAVPPAVDLLSTAAAAVAVAVAVAAATGVAVVTIELAVMSTEASASASSRCGLPRRTVSVEWIERSFSAANRCRDCVFAPRGVRGAVGFLVRVSAASAGSVVARSSHLKRAQTAVQSPPRSRTCPATRESVRITTAIRTEPVSPMWAPLMPTTE